MNKRATFLVLMTFLWVAGGCTHKRPQGRVIARIDGEVFTIDDLRAELSLLKPRELKALGANAQRRLHFMEGLIERWKMYAAAKKEGIDQLPEMRALVRAYETRLLQRKYLEQKVPSVKVGFKDVKAYYDKIKDERYLSRGMVRVRRIVVKTKKEADEVLKALKRGEDFGKLAGEYNTIPRLKAKKGDLGYLGRGVLPPEVQKVVDKMNKTLEVAGPIKTREGYEFVQYIDRIKRAYVPLEKVYNDLVEEVSANRRAQAYKKLKEEIEKKLKVEVKESLINEFIKKQAGKIRVKARTNK